MLVDLPLNLEGGPSLIVFESNSLSMSRGLWARVARKKKSCGRKVGIDREVGKDVMCRRYHPSALQTGNNSRASNFTPG